MKCSGMTVAIERKVRKTVREVASALREHGLHEDARKFEWVERVRQHGGLAPCTLEFKGKECGYRGSVVECDKSYSWCAALRNEARYGRTPVSLTKPKSEAFRRALEQSRRDVQKIEEQW